MTEPTIFALSSGRGRAGIAVIRLSGPKVRFVGETLCGPLPAPRRASLRRLIHPADGSILDQALVLFMAAPLSFTGEDVLELHVHGSRAVINAVSAALGAIPDVRPAEPGEFTLRAFRNGRMDLLEVEALADLIDSQTEWQRRQAVEGGALALRQAADGWRAALLSSAALLEAAIEFSEESDVPTGLDSMTKHHLKDLAESIGQAVARGERVERLREGFRVVLAGKPNAGKSTLLNRLAQREVAIVSDEPGTTRDVLEVHLELGGMPVTLIDTAGLREAEGEVERQGVARARRAQAEADLVLWLSAVDDPAPPEASAPAVLTIITKADLACDLPQGPAISCTTLEGIDSLLDQIRQAAQESFAGAGGAAAGRLRQRCALERARTALQTALETDNQPEIVAEELRAAGRALESLTGRLDVEAVLGEIFSRFCIGK